MTPPGNVSTWPMQASLASKGDWQGLMKHNEKQRASCKAGRRRGPRLPPRLRPTT